MSCHSDKYEVTVSGKIRGKGRPRFARNGVIYTPTETKLYERLIRDKFIESYGEVRTENKVEVMIAASFNIPKSWSKRKKSEAVNKYAPVKPDIDNIVKIVLDSLNGVAYADDKQVVRILAEKIYREDEENIKIIVREIGSEEDGKRVDKTT